MSSISDDWDEASYSDEVYLNNLSIKRIQNKSIIYKFVFSILHLLKNIRNFEITDLLIPKLIAESVLINKLAIIKDLINDLNTDENPKKIIGFLLLLKNQIQCRLICSLMPESLDIVELQTNLEVIKYIKKYKGVVFALDCQFEIKNLGIIYSKDLKYHKIFENVLLEINKSNFAKYAKSTIIEKLEVFDLPSNLSFDEENKKILLKNPKSIQAYKKHPLYVIETVLSDSQCIHPKRPIEGYFKGDPIYPRKNIIKLKTERQLYLNGEQITTEKPYRKIYRNEVCKLLYAPWQTQDINLVDLSSSRYMDYFHENHIPINCFYVDHNDAALLAAKLKIRYKECVVGFRKRQIVLKGAFIENKYENFFRHALFEHIQTNKIQDINNDYEKCLLVWKKVARKVKKYKKIIERVG